MFDTTKFNKSIQNEVLKCIRFTSPGPHAFILVLSIARYTNEEQNSVQHFVYAFGEKIFRYFIVLFTKKDDLDEEGKNLDDHINSVSPTLQRFIEKCGRRVIAFNNRLKGDESDEQVRKLLSMIFENIEINNGECYKNEMYKETEKLLQEREAEIRKEAQVKRDKELQAIKESFHKKLSIEAEKHITKTAEEFQQWREEYIKKHEEEKKAREEQLQNEYNEQLKNVRDIARKEVVEENSGNVGNIWTGAKLLFPGVFTYF